MKRILSKITSTKFIITVWAAIIISFIVVKNIEPMNNIALALTTVPISYFIANQVQKRHYIDNNIENNNIEYKDNHDGQ